MRPALYHDTCHHRIYGLTCSDLDALREYADGCCQICGVPETETPRGRLVIDHLGDYGPHMVRGLLCDKCNTLMRHVDSGKVAATRPVRTYRHNAWCARRLDPRGMNVRYKPIPYPWEAA